MKSCLRRVDIDLKEENAEIDEYEELEDGTLPYVPISCPAPEAEKMSINDMIGLHDGFIKRGKAILERAVSVLPGVLKTKSVREDKSFESLLKERNEHVLKTRYDKESVGSPG